MIATAPTGGIRPRPPIGSRRPLTGTTSVRSVSLTVSALLFASVALLSAQSAVGQSVDWYPVLSDRGEGIYLYMRINGQSVVPTLTIEAEADGKPLPITTGKPDDVTGFLRTRIGNLDTFRMLRVTIEYEGRSWKIERPRNHIQL